MRHRDSIARWGVLVFASILCLAPCCISDCKAQPMRIEQFKRLKRPFWKKSQVAVDKQLALLDLRTEEKGFTFLAEGKDPAQAEEGKGIITLKVPDKTRHITIKHPEYGNFTWRVPPKYLRRKNHYQATLEVADSLKKKQWVVFHIDPKDAILHVDSTTYLLRQGTLEKQLTKGRHAYRVEAPFYEAVADSFTVPDSTRLTLNLRLQPAYSYLTVQTPWPDSVIYVDGCPVGREVGTSQRLIAGSHRLTVFTGKTCRHDAYIELERAEKKTVRIE